MTEVRKEFLVFALKVVLLTCLLGVAIDAVTANVAVQYFTVHHPHVVDSDSPWVMALVWGVGASWWFGLIAAVLLWWVNQRRTEPLAANRVVRMIPPALVAIWLTMMLVMGGVFAISSTVPADRRVKTFESDRRLMAVAIAHATEYVLGGIVVLVLLRQVAKAK